MCKIALILELIYNKKHKHLKYIRKNLLVFRMKLFENCLKEETILHIRIEYQFCHVWIILQIGFISNMYQCPIVKFQLLYSITLNIVHKITEPHQFRNHLIPIDVSNCLFSYIKHSCIVHVLRFVVFKWYCSDM